MDPLLRLKRYLEAQRKHLAFCMRENRLGIELTTNTPHRDLLKRKRTAMRKHWNELSRSIRVLDKLLLDAEKIQKPTNTKDACDHGWKWLGVLRRG
jgi:hypothetical protein